MNSTSYGKGKEVDMAFRQAVLTFNLDQLRRLIEEARLELDAALASDLEKGRFSDTRARARLCSALLGMGIKPDRIAICFIPCLSAGYILWIPTLSKRTPQPKHPLAQRVASRVWWLQTTREGQAEVANVMGKVAREERFWGLGLHKDAVLKELNIPQTSLLMRARVWSQLGLEDLKVRVVIKHGLGLNPEELFRDPDLSHLSDEAWAGLLRYLGRREHLLGVGKDRIKWYRMKLGLRKRRF